MKTNKKLISLVANGVETFKQGLSNETRGDYDPNLTRAKSHLATAKQELDQWLKEHKYD